MSKDIPSLTHHSSLITHHSSLLLDFNGSAALVGARQVRGQLDGGDHARMLRDAPARDVEGRAVVNRGAYERQAQSDVDRLAEREALDGDHCLGLVTRYHRVELAARRAQEDRVSRGRPRHFKPLAAARLDRRRYPARLLDAD